MERVAGRRRRGRGRFARRGAAGRAVLRKAVRPAPVPPADGERVQLRDRRRHRRVRGGAAVRVPAEQRPGRADGRTECGVVLRVLHAECGVVLLVLHAECGVVLRVLHAVL